MNEKIEFEINGVTYQATYDILGDTLVTYLPDGSSRITELRGLKPQSAALVHLKSYIRIISLNN